MISNASFELQKAIYQTLIATSELTTLLGGPAIYDHVPQRLNFPYITIGETIERDWSTSSDSGTEHFISLHVWSRDGGRNRAQHIVSLVKQALHERALTLDNHSLVNLRHEQTNLHRDPDGETFHGITRFRAVTEQSLAP